MSTILTILGAGSAKPTKQLTPSSQILDISDKQFLIDCGEGTQISMAHTSVRTNRLDHIFISHLHGDHCFGLLGLLSTWGMLGRTRSITIHAQPDLEQLLTPLLNYFCKDMQYDVKFSHINPRKHEIIYDDRTILVKTLPLKHSVPCCGFLFEQKQRLPHIKKEMIDIYQIPLTQIPSIKQGGDFICADGRIIPHSDLTTPANPPFRYAYCSDTAYYEKLIDWIYQVDCLYHEATFTNQYEQRCKETMHSTAQQAAYIAKKAKVGQLILGHFSSRLNDLNISLKEAQEVFQNTILAQDRSVFDLQH